MPAYTAMLTRCAGGVGIKIPRRSGDLFMVDTRPANVATFFRTWPRHLTTFLCGYGRSALRHPAASPALAEARRGYFQVALAEQADLAQELQLNPSTLNGLSNGEATLEPAEPVAEPAAAPARATLHTLRCKHAKARPISMVTAYDYPSARLADAAGGDVVLVGDSLGMVVLGREDTTDVTMDEMVHHCKAASRGAARAMLVGDLPFGSCVTPLDAALNGVRLVKEGRVDAVKIEGGERAVPQVRALVDAGVAVVGHIGLTPQSYVSLGGYRVQLRHVEI